MPRSDSEASAFKCAGRAFSSKNPLIVAEAGTSHGGSLTKALELINAAAESGADCVKFQWFYADEILPKNAGSVSLPCGEVDLYERFKALEAPRDFLSALKTETEKLGRIFLCSPFGERSARELLSLRPDVVKIASPELNHIPLLKQTSAAGIPLILSSGVSKLGDIERAIDVCAQNGAGSLALLHCVTAYPAPIADYNLRVLPAMARIFGAPCGVSDHSADPLVVPLTALAQGACVIEKHFTLGNNDGGLDDATALAPDAFARMSKEIKLAARLIAVPNQEDAALLDELKREFGAELIESALGTGKKTLAPSEKDNYTRTNRSVHARRFIAAGEKLCAENIAILRTEKKLRPGLSPEYYDFLIGKTAARAIPEGEGVRMRDIFAGD